MTRIKRVAGLQKSRHLSKPENYVHYDFNPIITNLSIDRNCTYLCVAAVLCVEKIGQTSDERSRMEIDIIV